MKSYKDVDTGLVLRVEYDGGLNEFWFDILFGNVYLCQPVALKPHQVKQLILFLQNCLERGDGR